MAKVLVSLSGGLDSTTVLAKALKEGYEASAVIFRYPSKHNSYESSAAAQVASYFKVHSRSLDLSLVFSHFKSALLKSGGALPEGHYEEETMRQTVVPFRNGIFMAVLAGLAESLGAAEIWLGTHAGDSFIYPDCRPDFVNAMTAAIEFGTDKKVTTATPFEFINKTELLRQGIYELGAAEVYKLTRTCYADQPVACGRCGSCQERLGAFAALGLVDPIEYKTRELLAKTGG